MTDKPQSAKDGQTKPVVSVSGEITPSSQSNDVKEGVVPPVTGQAQVATDNSKRDPLDSSPLPTDGRPLIVKLFVGILVVLLVAVLGYGGYWYFTQRTSSSEPEVTEITYWGLWEPTGVIDQVLADFQNQHPEVKVNYVQQSKQDYRERLQNALQSGQGPDVFRFHNTWTPMLSSQLASLPSSVMSQAEYSEAFYPVASEWLTTSSGIVGVPLMIDGLGLYYNVDVMESAGITPPTTWEELRRTAKQLTIAQDDQILRAGVALGTTNNVEHWSDILGVMLLQNSANPVKPNNQLGQDALTFYTLFSTRDRVWDKSLPTATQAFATEKVVMMIAPSWRAHEVADINQEIRFAIAPVPQLPDTNVTWASFWAEGVSEKTDRATQEASWELLRYLSQKETLRAFYAAATAHPGRIFGEPFSRVDMADQLIRDPYVGAYIQQAPKATSWYLASETYDNGLNDRVMKYYEDAINAMNDGGQADAVLTTVEQGVEQVLSQYGLQ